MTEEEIDQIISELKRHIDVRFDDLREEISPTLYTIEEICDIVGISTKTFYRWQKGPEPVFTIVQRGATKRIPKASLDSFLKEYKVRGKHK